MPIRPKIDWLTRASSPEVRAGLPALEPEKLLILALRSVWARPRVNPQKGRIHETPN